MKRDKYCPIIQRLSKVLHFKMSVSITFLGKANVPSLVRNFQSRAIGITLFNPCRTEGNIKNTSSYHLNLIQSRICDFSGNLLMLASVSLGILYLLCIIVASEHMKQQHAALLWFCVLRLEAQEPAHQLPPCA